LIETETVDADDDADQRSASKHRPSDGGDDVITVTSDRKRKCSSSDDDDDVTPACLHGNVTTRCKTTRGAVDCSLRSVTEHSVVDRPPLSSTGADATSAVPGTTSRSDVITRHPS